MSEQEKFLARWSRRKRKAGTQNDTPPAGSGMAPETKGAPEAPANDAKSANDVKKIDAEKSGEAFDVSQLPSLDSISADTDIRDFLKPGVPADLSRAALRRAWAADPAIRDFIGLSENSWDFNADEMHGFGPLEPSDLRKLLAQATGIPEPVEQTSDATAAAARNREEVANTASDMSAAPDETRQQVASSPLAENETNPVSEPETTISQSHNSYAAAQHEERPLPTRRKSGGALPT